MADVEPPRPLPVPPPPELDTGVPHSARMYDYLLGGTTNFAADRAAAEAALTLLPAIRTAARENRGCMARAVRHLAAEHGVRQFLDIGTGIPTSPSPHEVAQAVAPEARVVYVDNDPMVHAHARTLLTSSAAGGTDFVSADVREAETVIEAAGRTLDFSRPVAVVCMAMLHFVPDTWNPRDILDRLLAPLCGGSYLLASHATADGAVDDSVGRAVDSYRRSGIAMQARTHDEFAALLLGGRDAVLLPPGVVPVQDLLNGDATRPCLAETACYGALVRLL